jgi:predicted RNA-binding protein with PUA-like domain
MRYGARHLRVSAMAYWLFKSEPEVFSIDDLFAAPKRTTAWDGVRNYKARNYLRDEVKVGDGVLFYHSNAEPSGVAGTCVVARAGYPDATQFDPKDDHYDPDAKKDEPRWYLVDVKAEHKFARFVPLHELKSTRGLEKMGVIQKGNRLSIQKVTKAEWDLIVKLGV